MPGRALGERNKTNMNCSLLPQGTPKRTNIYVTVLCSVINVPTESSKDCMEHSRAVPSPWAMDWYGLWPIRNQASQQKVSGG